MKDLKHYFVSPKGSPTECDLVSRDSAMFEQATVSNSSSTNGTCSTNATVLGKSKRTKRKRKEVGDFVEKPDDLENIALNVKVRKLSKQLNKKRGKSDFVLKTNKGVPENVLEIPKDEVSIKGSSGLECNGVLTLTNPNLKHNTGFQRKSSRKRQPNTKYNDFSDVSCIQEKSNDSLRETSTNEIFNNSVIKKEITHEHILSVSENDERDCSTPENTKNLFNYFNKVDKLPDIEKKPHIIKVEAMVHVPCSDRSEASTPKSIIKRKSVKKQVLEIDYDLITLEGTDVIETNNPPSSKEWKMQIQVADKSSASPECEEKTLETLNEKTLEKDMLTRLSKDRNEILNKNLIKKRKLHKSIDNQVEILNTDELKKKKSEPDLSDRILPKKKQNENKEDVLSKHDKRKRKLEPESSVSSLPKKKPPALEECEVEFVCEIKKEKSKAKNDGTLASFFQIGRKPPAITSEQKLAKQAFLNSGAPDLIKRITSIKHDNNFQGKDAPYPGKSHVQQKDKMNIMWNLSLKKFNFFYNDQIVLDSKWSSILPNQLKFERRSMNELQASNATSLSELKKELNLYPIRCWSKELKRFKKGKDGLIWTERYRPHLASTFLANTRNIHKLKAWLTELKENSCADSGDSSGDEFIKDDDKESTKRKTVILLSGLPGTGKTAAVYAIAEEIGYHVLEINASDNRSGKRIFNQFSEAMQSHKVGVSKLNFSKAKKKTEHPKRSLVLIEDADLLFEDDEGFVPTLINLAAGTKRPMILVVNNSQTKHLSKLTAICHASLHFTPPSQDRLESWLRTISAVEGFSLSEMAAAELASTQDIRKSLLQLQFSKEKVSLNRYGDLEESIWNRIGYYSFDSAKERKKAKFHLSSLVTLDIIRKNERSSAFYPSPYWQSSPRDSTSTNECYELPNVESLDEYESYFLKLMNVQPKLSRFQQFENSRNLYDIEKTAFSLTNILSRRSNAVDLWPAIRQISRNEASRLASHTKRNNRYFNYLSSVGISGPPDVIQSLSSPFKKLS